MMVTSAKTSAGLEGGGGGAASFFINSFNLFVMLWVSVLYNNRRGELESTQTPLQPA